MIWYPAVSILLGPSPRAQDATSENCLLSRFHGDMSPSCSTYIQTLLLGSDYSLIQNCVNRPGIVYAWHCVIESFERMENYCCFVRNPFPPNGTLQDQPRVLMFFDNSTLAHNSAKILNQNAPPQFRGTNFALHYYSIMSPTYLEIAHREFTTPDGSCQILCATSGESTVSEFSFVRI